MIAILGWGSLLWDTNAEFDQRHTFPWKFDGPELKLEFSRISASRNKALTLVIDLSHGSLCKTAYCHSKRRNLDDALADLRCREGTVIDNIGYVDLAMGKSRCRNDEVATAIAQWAKAKSIGTVVWTDLDSNFKQKAEKIFSVANATSHIVSLDAEGKAKAAEYVWRAPDFIKTPLRSALEAEPWFEKPKQ